MVLEIKNTFEDLNLLDSSAARDRIALRPKARRRTNHHRLLAQKTESSQKSFENLIDLAEINLTKDDANDVNKSESCPRFNQRRYSEQSSKKDDVTVKVKKSHSFKSPVAIVTPSLDDVGKVKLRKTSIASGVSSTTTKSMPDASSKRFEASKSTGSGSHIDEVESSSPSPKTGLEKPKLSLFTKWEDRTNLSPAPLLPPKLLKKAPTPLSNKPYTGVDSNDSNRVKNAKILKIISKEEDVLVTGGATEPDAACIEARLSDSPFNVKLKKSFSGDLSTGTMIDNDFSSKNVNDAKVDPGIKASEEPVNNDHCLISSSIQKISQQPDAVSEKEQKFFRVNLKKRSLEKESESISCEYPEEREEMAKTQTPNHGKSLDEKEIQLPSKIFKKPHDFSEKLNQSEVNSQISNTKNFMEDKEEIVCEADSRNIFHLQNQKDGSKRYSTENFDARSTGIKQNESSHGRREGGTEHPWKHVLRKKNSDSKAGSDTSSNKHVMEDTRINQSDTVYVKPVKTGEDGEIANGEEANKKINNNTLSASDITPSDASDGKPSIFTVKLRKVIRHDSSRPIQEERVVEKPGNKNNHNNSRIDDGGSFTLESLGTFDSKVNRVMRRSKSAKESVNLLQHEDSRIKIDPSWVSLARRRSEQYKSGGRELTISSSHDDNGDLKDEVLLRGNEIGTSASSNVGAASDLQRKGESDPTISEGSQNNPSWLTIALNKQQRWSFTETV